MLMENGAIVLDPTSGRTLPLGPHQIRFIFREPGSPYSLLEWMAPPWIPGPPLHIHRETDEAFYVLEGACGFQVGDETVVGAAGAFVRVPRGLPHTFWNAGAVSARLLILFSPVGFESYFEDLSIELAKAGDSQEAAISVRQRLGAKHDIEVVGPPRQAEATTPLSDQAVS